MITASSSLVHHRSTCLSGQNPTLNLRQILGCLGRYRYHSEHLYILAFPICVTRISSLWLYLHLKMFFYPIPFAALALTVLPTIVHAHLKAPGAGNSIGDGVPKLGAVASESAVCSHIGTNLIKKGGNAADAVGALHSRLHKHGKD